MYKSPSCFLVATDVASLHACNMYVCSLLVDLLAMHHPWDGPRVVVVKLRTP